jgi:hypothetical protein
MEWTKYKDIRSEIKSGDVYFTRATSIFGKLVNIFTGSYIPHVGLFLVISSRIFCVEINIFGKVSMYLASEFLKDADIYHAKTNISIDEDDIFKDLGQIKYNYLGVFLAPFFYRVRSTRQDCAEWVAEKLHLEFSHLERGIYPSDILTVFCDQRE